MSERDEVLSSIAGEVVQRVNEDMAAKQMTLDDSAALLRVNSKAVTKGTMEGIVYGTGTYVLMTLFKTQKRYRAPMSGFIGLLHFVTAAGKAKRPEVLVAEFLPCETPLGDYVRGEVERRLPEDDPLARLHRQVSDLVRQNPSMSRIEARARVMTGRMPDADGIAPTRVRVREERAQRNRKAVAARRETEEQREERQLDEEESYESVYGAASSRDEHEREDLASERVSQLSQIEASEPILEKELYGYDDPSRAEADARWDDDYHSSDDLYGSELKEEHGADRLDEFSGVSKLEVAKQRRKERLRRERKQGRRKRYGSAPEYQDSEGMADDDEKYHSRYEHEYNDSRFGGSTDLKWEDEYVSDEHEGPTFTRSSF